MFGEGKKVSQYSQPKPVPDHIRENRDRLIRDIKAQIEGLRNRCEVEDCWFVKQDSKLLGCLKFGGRAIELDKEGNAYIEVQDTDELIDEYQKAISQVEQGEYDEIMNTIVRQALREFVGIGK